MEDGLLLGGLKFTAFMIPSELYIYIMYTVSMTQRELYTVLSYCKK